MDTGRKTIFPAPRNAGALDAEGALRSRDGWRGPIGTGATRRFSRQMDAPSPTTVGPCA
jgi:hypothetical protein